MNDMQTKEEPIVKQRLLLFIPLVIFIVLGIMAGILNVIRLLRGFMQQEEKGK